MRPDPSRVLFGVAGTLSKQLMTEEKSPFGGYLTGTLAVEIERIADRLYRENKELASLLAEAEPLVEDDLRARISAAQGETNPPNLLVSTLVDANDRLRALPIDVHVVVESQPGDSARAMDARIWDEIRESTCRRHIGIGAY